MTVEILSKEYIPDNNKYGIMIWTLNAKKLEAERRKIGRGLLYNWTSNAM